MSLQGIMRCSAALSAAVLLAGCAHTPARRIERNPELFASFPPEAQDKIREGRIELGFTPPMVELALGAPNRRATRETERGVAEVWLYTRLDERRIEPMFVPVPVYVRGRGGAGYTVPEMVWVDREIWQERVYLRVEFMDGRVAGIETTER
jgi:hypothetical protein